MAEFWQAGKWIHDSDLNDLTPMWANFEVAPHRHFYVNEIAQLRGGRFEIPQCYGKVAGIEVVELFEVVFYEALSLSFTCYHFYETVLMSGFLQTSTFVVRSDAIIQIEASNLTKNMLDLEAEAFLLHLRVTWQVW